MAKKTVKKEPKTERTDLKSYKLKRDYPTTKGVKKAGAKIMLTEEGKRILTKQNYL